MTITRKALALFALLLVLGTATAQEGSLIPFAAAYLPPVGAFNGQFATAGVPQAAERHYGWGIELRSLVSGFLVGPMFFRTWDEVENDSYQLRTDATCILGEIGIKLVPFDFLTITPMIGAGGLSQSFNIRSQVGDIRLDSLLVRPGQNAVIQSGMQLAGMAALELGLSAPISGARYGVTMRGGYLYSPFEVNWHLANGAVLLETPKDLLGGLFFTVGVLIQPAAETSSASF